MPQSSNRTFVSLNYLDVLAKRIAAGSMLKISIMGKDPYPGAKTNIPFCKPDWASMWSADCCGASVLGSLGIYKKKVAASYQTPEELFLYLAEQHGIAFLNVSYQFIGGPLRKKKHEQYLKHAAAINRDVLRNSKNILLLGEAKKHKWYGEVSGNTIEIVHPDRRCEISRYANVRQEWQKWWSRNQLAAQFGLSI